MTSNYYCKPNGVSCYKNVSQCCGKSDLYFITPVVPKLCSAEITGPVNLSVRSANTFSEENLDFAKVPNWKCDLIYEVHLTVRLIEMTLPL